MFESEGVRGSLRGIKKCPKCKTYNGYRSKYCKNKSCSEILVTTINTLRVPIESSKLKTDSTSSIYSVRIRNTGPDYRGFVELHNTENYWISSTTVQNNSSPGVCHIKSCILALNQNYTTETKPSKNVVNCNHIQASVNTKINAVPLTINKSALDKLKISSTMKQEIWKISMKHNIPLVQRVSSQVMVVKTKKTKKHPLGYLHMLFLPEKQRHYCSCDLFTSKSIRRQKLGDTRKGTCSVLKKNEAYNGKCFHFYACISAFVSDAKLSEEFKYFVNLVSNDSFSNLTNTNINETSKNDFIISMINVDDSQNIIELPEDPSENMEIENVTSPYVTQSVELQDGNTLMMEIHTNDMNENTKDGCKVKLNDVILVKAKNDNEVLNMCDLFLADSSNDHKNNNSNKPLDIQIMLAEDSDVIKLPNYVIKQIPVKIDKQNNNTKSIDDDLKNGTDDNNSINLIVDEIGSPCDINNMNNDDFILSDEYNALEIMSLEQYSNYLNSKQECFDYPLQEDISKSPDYDNEFLLLESNSKKNYSECKKINVSDFNKKNKGRNVNSSNSNTSQKTLNEFINLQEIVETQNSEDNIYVFDNNLAADIIKIGERMEMREKNSIQSNRMKQNVKKNVINNNTPPDCNILPNLTFFQWLGSVTERINQTMHFQLNGKPDPFIYHIPKIFFECLQQRMCLSNGKQRLPNSITEIARTKTPPLGKFTKYTWSITSIKLVKQIFDTPNISLDTIKFFTQNNDGTYSEIKKPFPLKQNMNESFGSNKSMPAAKIKILPGILITYLKVGILDQKLSHKEKVMPAFSLEWTPDIFPISNTGELCVKFEYGHKNNFVV